MDSVLPMPIAALAGWFGGKRTIAPRIVAALGPHQAYCEPFCGSMAVLLAKPRARQEVVNDLHRDLANLAHVVQDDDQSTELFDRLARTAFCEELHREAVDWLSRQSRVPEGVAGPYPLDRAYWYFVACWQGKGGYAGTVRGTRAGFAKRYTSNGGDGATRFRNAVESLPAWWERLRGVTILSEDGVELVGRVEDKAGTAVYVDPPYLAKGEKYQHDFTAADHERLAAALRRFRHTRVVVSYYAHPELERLYPGWEKVEVAANKGLANATRSDGGPVRAAEVLLVNGPTEP